jgi:hypothetical protein
MEQQNLRLFRPIRIHTRFAFERFAAKRANLNIQIKTAIAGWLPGATK